MIYGFGFSISAILAIPAILAISSGPRLSAFICGKNFVVSLADHRITGSPDLDQRYQC